MCFINLLFISYLEFFDEVNMRRAQAEIVKQQSKIRLQYTDKEQCERLCNQIHDSISMQSESLSKSDIRKQIGKVLFDVKVKLRKQNNEPPRKPRIKKENDTFDT